MKMDLERYRGKCGCGKDHNLPTKEIIIQRGATELFPDMIERLKLPKRCSIICDNNTSDFAVLVARQIGGGLHPLRSVVVLNSENLHADENAVARVTTQLPVDVGWLVAAGSGTIHDITRYVANQRGIPFIAYPTAASVDGFVSNVCAMTWHGFKKTLPGTAPIAVLADTDVFLTAPRRLAASGMSDVLGKYIALADWHISHLLGAEDYCPVISDLMRNAVDRVREAMPGVTNGESAAMEKLMEALLLSGIAMQLWDNSRPASGGEHHLSHFWEMEVLNGPLEALHGEKVGVGLSILLPIYKQVAATWNPESHITAYKGIPHPLLKDKFGVLYGEVTEANTPDPLNESSGKTFLEKQDAIREILLALPDAEALRRDMDAAGCPVSLAQIGLTEDILAESKLLSPFVRGRVSFLRVCNLMTDYEV